MSKVSDSDSFQHFLNHPLFKSGLQQHIDNYQRMGARLDQPPMSPDASSAGEVKSSADYQALA